jgi:hypothetical protein
MFHGHDSKLLDADVVWPNIEQVGEVGFPDAALLKIRGIDDCLKSRIGPPDPPQDSVPVVVWACGFPAFRAGSKSRRGERKIAGEPERDTEEITGEILVGAKVLSGRYEIKDMTVRDRRELNDKVDWKGFSGAGLLWNGRLIGLLIARKIEGDRYDFSAVRIENLLAIPDFLNTIHGSVERENIWEEGDLYVERPPRPDLSRLMCLLGHDCQEGEFISYHSRCGISSGVQSGRSLVCLLPGAHEFRHCPTDLSDRFTIKTLPELQWPRHLVFQWLSWRPSSNLSKSENLSNLRREFWNLLAPPDDSSPPNESEPYRKLLATGSRPRLFLSDLSEHDHNDFATLLEEWVQFWAALSPLPEGGPPIHLVMLGAQGVVEIRQWLSTLKTESVVIEPFTPLDRCTPNELVAWLNHRLPLCLSQRDMSWLQSISIQLRSEFGAANFYRHSMKVWIDKLAVGASGG